MIFFVDDVLDGVAVDAVIGVGGVGDAIVPVGTIVGTIIRVGIVVVNPARQAIFAAVDFPGLKLPPRKPGLSLRPIRKAKQAWLPPAPLGPLTQPTSRCWR